MAVQPKQGKPGGGEHQQTVVKRAPRKHDHEGHGGAWKVAFADFCLALLSLFLVLWLLAARNTESLKEAMKSAGVSVREGGGSIGDAPSKTALGSLIERFPLPAHADNPSIGDGQSAVGAGSVKRSYDTPAELKELAKKVDAMAAQAGLEKNVQGLVTPQGLRLMIHDTDNTGMFERGRAVPSERFVGLLRKLGPMLAQIKNQLLIVGHTDSLQYAITGPAGFSNTALSTDRAMSARLHLMEGGMPAASVLQVSGMADRAPLDAAHPNAAVNRRIELLIMTSAQSQAMAAMFGAPSQAWPLTDGVDASVSTKAALHELRAAPAPASAGG